MSKKDSEKAKKVMALLKFGILILILVGIPLYIYFYQKDLIETFSSLENVQAYLEQYKHNIMLIYILCQCLQIIICFIPGQWLQIAIGYLFDIPIGLGLSIIGAIIGSVITYYLARFLGHDAVHMFFGEEKIKEMVHRLNSKRGIIIIFLIFLIPGIPKDLVNYAAGLSSMKLKPFLIVSIIGRTPGMLGSIIIGYQLNVGGYVVAIAVAVIAVICFILGIVFRKRINQFLDRLYDKYMGEEI